MEVIFAIAAIIIFIVRAVKASESKQKNQNEGTQTPPQRPIAFSDAFEQFREIEKMRAEQAERDRNFEGVTRPDGEGYNQARVERNDYSKYPEYTKGYVSVEGTNSSEGKCIEPNANHCAVEHSEDSDYASEITDEAVAFSRDDIVKGIIMAEILSKPKCME